MEELSDGLEGRSNNPISVLFDTLMRPNADIGEDHAPSLTWTHDPSKAIPHIVIGNGKPGGSWHHMQPDLETVSLGHWLELPGYPFNQWKMEQDRNRTGDVKSAAIKGNRKRALLGEIAQYYNDYVSKMELEKNFLNGVEVVCALDMRRSKVDGKPPVFESRCSSSSRLSSLSSSPGLYSPSHVTDEMPSIELLRSMQEDVGYQRLADGVFEEYLLAAAGDNCIVRVDSGTSVGEVSDHVHVHVPQQSDEGAKTPAGDMSPVRDDEVRGGNQDNDSVPFQIQPFTTDSEPRQIECFPETNCCCLSDPDDSGVFCHEAKKLKPEYRWCIKGRWKSSQDEHGSHDGGKCVKILAKKLVLACGVGQHRKLGVPGEDLPFVHHQYSDLVPAVDGSSCLHDDPILVVGAGLSAADAVLLGLKRGVRVIHTFYQDASDSGLIFHKMPPSMYQEYRHVFALMQGKAIDDNYTPLPRHKVMEFKQGGTCQLKSTDSEHKTELKISSCHVLIGSEANLGFLPQRLTSTLGIKADTPIRPKLNPIDIHPYSFQSESVPSLYAVGPLVGDNFVRFVLGGALGIAHHMVNNSRSKDV